MKDYIYTCEMETRDYECDVQGVVNNANYQHYFEVTRHNWIKSEGFGFQKWHDQGLDMMVSEITIKYKNSLHGQEEFICGLNLRREGARFVFDQDIYRKSDGVLCASAKVTAICVVNGHVTRGDEIAELFAKYL